MAKIIAITKYKIEGRAEEFDTLRKAIESLEYDVVRFIEKAPGLNDLVLHKNKIAYFSYILANRKKLIELLSYDLPDVEECECGCE